MSLTVRYFASVREAIGIASESWPTDIPTPTTVAQARAALVARGSPWAEALAESRVLRAAVNQQMVDAAAPLAPQDELAFFPPVTGG
jgi:molybdopterin synthase sulfur carrier subunit